MEHWLAVGSDIWWVVKWPLFCGLWISVGAGMQSREFDEFGPGLLILAILVTLGVANT